MLNLNIAGNVYWFGDISSLCVKQASAEVIQFADCTHWIVILRQQKMTSSSMLQDWNSNNESWLVTSKMWIKTSVLLSGDESLKKFGHLGEKDAVWSLAMKLGAEKKIVIQGSQWSAVPVTLLYCCFKVVRLEQGSGSKGFMSCKTQGLTGTSVRV